MTCTHLSKFFSCASHDWWTPPCRKQTNDREGKYEKCFIKDLSGRTHTFHNKKYSKISMRLSIMVACTVLPVHVLVNVKASSISMPRDKDVFMRKRSFMYVYCVREPVTNGSLHNGQLRSKVKLLTQACAALLFF
jgi:hypothetical protein